MNESILLFGYAAIVAVGGIMGFVKGRSVISLVSGLVSGALLAAAGILMRQGNPAGFYVGLIVSILLTAIFIMRWMKTRSFMPSGLMIVVCIIFLILFLINR